MATERREHNKEKGQFGAEKITDEENGGSQRRDDSQSFASAPRTKMSRSERTASAPPFPFRRWARRRFLSCSKAVYWGGVRRARRRIKFRHSLDARVPPAWT